MTSSVLSSEAIQPAPPVCLFENPHRLVSLLEMQLLSVAAMMHITSFLHHLYYKGVLPISKKHDPGEESRTAYKQLLVDLEKTWRDLDLVASIATIKRIGKALDNVKRADYREVSQLCMELEGRLADEMNGRLFWSLSLRVC